MVELWQALAAGVGLGILIGWNMRIVLDYEADVELMSEVAERLTEIAR